MRYYLFILLFFYIFIANSQNISIGLGVSPEITIPIDRRSELKTRLGSSFGLLITKKISKKHLWVNTGLGITNRGYQFRQVYGYNTAKWNYSATDIDIPLLLQYQFRKEKRLFGFFSLGTIFGVKIKEGVDSSGISYRYNDKKFDYPDRINLRLAIGIGYKMNNNLQFQAEPFIMKDIMALQRNNWKYGYFSNTYSWGIRVICNYSVSSRKF